MIKASQISHDKWPTIYQFPILSKTDAVMNHSGAKVELLWLDLMNRCYIFSDAQYSNNRHTVEMCHSQWLTMSSDKEYIISASTTTLCNDYVVTKAQCCHYMAALCHHLSSNVRIIYIVTCTTAGKRDLVHSVSGIERHCSSSSSNIWEKTTASMSVNFTVPDRWDQ